jgi:DNA-binding MurR/RpiR family transcriptional regulator
MRAERGEDIRQSSVRKLARALGVSPATLQRAD